MRGFSDCIRVFLERVLAVATPEVTELVYLLLLGLYDVLGDLGLSFRDSFLAFSMACPDATDPTSLVFRIVDRLTLKGLSMDSSLAIPLLSFSLFGRVTCL